MTEKTFSTCQTLAVMRAPLISSGKRKASKTNAG